MVGISVEVVVVVASSEGEGVKSMFRKMLQICSGPLQIIGWDRPPKNDDGNTDEDILVYSPAAQHTPLYEAAAPVFSAKNKQE